MPYHILCKFLFKTQLSELVYVSSIPVPRQRLHHTSPVPIRFPMVAHRNAIRSSLRRHHRRLQLLHGITVTLIITRKAPTKNFVGAFLVVPLGLEPRTP